MTTQVRSRGWRIGLLAVCLGLPCLAWPADPSGAPPPAARVHRVYAPADRVDQWPLGRGRYLPVDAAEFDRLLATLKESSARGQALATPRVVESAYDATLSADFVLTGHATLQIAHAAPTAALLPLEPCGLALGKAAWIGASPPETAAVLGTGADGRSGVLVDRAGTLRFDWSLRGRADVSGGIHFDLRFPACPAGHLSLELAEKWTVAVTAGIPVTGTSVASGVRRWNVELGGRPHLDLTLLPPDSSNVHHDTASVRQATVYEVTPHGLDVSVQMSIEDVHRPLHEVLLAVDSGLQLVTARLGNRAVPWFMIGVATDGSMRVELQLPEPIEGGSPTLRFGAIAPLVSDRPWRLPRVRTQEMTWEQGTATLVTPLPMVLDQVAPDGCRQTSAGSLPAPRSGTTAQFESFAPDATLEVVVTRSPPRLQVTSGTTVLLTGTGMKSQFAADLRAAVGEIYVLDADVAPQWIIGSVEVTPKDLLDDWSIERTAGKSKLRIALSRPLTASRSAVVRIEARRPFSPLGRKLALEEVLPLRLSRAADARRLVSLTTEDSYELKLTGGELLNRPDARRLDARELALLDGRPGELLFVDDSGAAALRVAMEHRQPRYAANIRVRATVADGVLYESYGLRCLPESGGIDRIRVHFAPRRDAPMRWSLGNEDDPQLTARLVPAAEGTPGGLLPDEEVWELEFRHPRNTAFEVSGVRHVPLSVAKPVSLASLPEAASQRGLVTVNCLGPKEVRIKNTRLVPVPAETGPGANPRGFRAAYRYHPSRDISTTPEPALSLSLSDERLVAAAWVSRSELRSHYAVDGAGVHVASCRVEGVGGGTMQLTLPAGVLVDEVRLDQEPALWQRQKADSPTGEVRLLVELPPGDAIHVLTVGFRTTGNPLGRWGTLEPPLPRSDLPSLPPDWTVGLPPGFVATDIDPRWQATPVPPRSWRQRLFGALGRPAGANVWNPLDFSQWSLLGDNPVIPTDVAQKRADLLLQQIGTLSAGPSVRAEAESLDWGSLLVTDAIRDLPGTLLIDEPSLSRDGLTARTAVQPAYGETPNASAVLLMCQANLAVLLDGEAMVLTTQSAAALLHDSLQRCAADPIWQVTGAPLHQQVQAALSGNGAGGFLLTDVWNRRPRDAAAVASLARLEGCEPADIAGWTAYRLEIPVGSPLHLTYVHQATWQALGWIAFLGMGAIGLGIASRRPLLLLASLGLWAAAALTVSDAFTPIASGGVLGTLFCLGWIVILRPGRRAEDAAAAPTPDAELGSTVTGGPAQAVVLLLAAATIFGAQSASAQTAKPKTTRPVAPRYEVFIPADERQQPVGNKYYVPEELYRQLNVGVAAAEGRVPGWLLRGATYRGNLDWEAAPEHLAVSDLKVVFDLVVASAPARVRIPVVREAVRSAPDAVLLDGRAVAEDWESGMLAVGVADPGPHRLELRLRPTSRAAGNSAGIDLAIPTIANARLVLNLPAGAPTVEVPSALGEVRREDDPAQLVANLGPTSRLTVTWEERARRNARTTVDVEELLWVKILPNSVVIDARFRYRVIEGLLREVHLLASPRLRLLPLPKTDGPTVQVQTVPGPSQLLRFEWPHNVADQATLDVSFLVTGASAVGNLRIPQLESPGCRSTKRCLAVTVDPSLAVDDRLGDRPPLVTTPVFLGDWGSSENVPQIVYRLPAGATSWGLAVRPRETRTTADQTLSISFAPGTVHLQFDAQLTTAGGPCFQHRLSTPAGLEIDHVSVIAEKAERFDRLSAGRSDLRTLFLSGPVTGKHTLSLRAHLPIPSSGSMALPLIQYANGEVQSSTLEILRQPGSLVKVTKSAGLTEIGTLTAEPTRPDLGRLIKAFAVDGNQAAQATVQFWPNQPTADARQVLRLQAEGSTWTAQAEFTGDVKGGVVDQFQVDAPTPWNGPYQVDPPAKVKVVEPPGGTRHLVIEPLTAISGKYHVTIASPLSVEAGEAVSVPDVRLESIVPRRRLVVLPTRLGSRPLAWELHGLAQLDAKSEPAGVRNGRQTTLYQVRADSFRAVLKTDQPSRSPEINLADVFVALRDDGSVRGICTFDLDPARASECMLWMPAHARWVTVSVGGVPVVPEPQGDRLWRVPLVLGRLPQPIEVVFTGVYQPPSSGAGQRISAPIIRDVVVKQTLWTVAGPPRYRSPEVAGANPIAALDADRVRLKNLVASSVFGPVHRSSETDERWRWHQLWSQRLASALAGLQQSLLPSGTLPAQRTEAPTPLQEELQTAERQREQLVRWMIANPPSGTPGLDSPESEVLVAQRYRPSVPADAASYFFERQADVVRVIFPAADAGGTGYRWAGAVAMLAVALALLLASRHAASWPILGRWPVASGLLAGMVWWRWFTPSAVGWGLIVVCLAAALYGRRVRRRRETAAIIVVGS